MSKIQKKNLLVILFVGLAYFVLFILPNLQGSKDAIMLSVFEQDEYAEYPYVLRMLTPDLSFFQTIRYFIIYLFYYYGYPFYFFSALTLLPVKWIIGPDWTQHTQLIVLILRQMINVLPGILAAGLLTYLQTRFVSRWKTLFIFLALLLFPPLVVNNLWWHPDGLLVLFCVLVLFFLDMDQFRYKKGFFLAAIAVGIAVATKIIGLFFFLTILVYLLIGLFKKKITLPRSLLLGMGFIGLMILAYIISNPVILLPIERGEVIKAYQSGFSQLTNGFYEKAGGIIRWISGWPQLSRSYGHWVFVFATLALPVLGIVLNKNRRINLLILPWVVVNYVYFAFFVTTMKNYYLLPSALPLLSCLGTLLCFLPDDSKTNWKEFLSNNKKTTLLILLLGLFLAQYVGFTRNNLENWKYAVNKEKDSKSIQFFNHLDEDYLSKLPADRQWTIYRDWRAYVREQPNWNLLMDWNFANYEYLEDQKVDVLILEFDNIHYFSQPATVENALNVDQSEKRNLFYSDAANGSIKGYHLLYRDDFGSFFVSDSLFDEYFK